MCRTVRAVWYKAVVIGVVDVSYGACCLVQAAVIGVVDVSYGACCLVQAAVIGVVDVSYGACCLVQAAVIGVVDVSYNACCLVGAAAGRSVCNSWVAWGVGTVCSVRAAWCALCFGAANLKGLRMLLIQVRVCSSHSKACLVTQVSFGYAGLVRSWVLSPAYLVLWHRVELSGFLTT